MGISTLMTSDNEAYNQILKKELKMLQSPTQTYIHTDAHIYSYTHKHTHTYIHIHT